MALPKVNVNVDEQTLLAANTEIPFVPAVLIKTKSGPIGTIETLTSEAQFKALFGESDYTVPSAFAIQTYLRSYSYVLVTRLANEEEAAIGTGTMQTENQGSIDLLKVDTVYKTDLFNGKEVKLVYDGTNHKLWLDVSSVTGKNTISIKEDFTADSDKAPALSTVLDKLAASVNAANLGFTITNLYTDKMEEDTTPSLESFQAGISVFIEGGNSGNTSKMDDSKVKSIIDSYDLPEKNIDVMVIPEYTNFEITNYAANLAFKNNFVVLVSASGNNVTEAEQSVSNFATDNRGSLICYYPDVYYNNFVDPDGNKVAIPLSMAVLHTYARTDIQNKWGAPAGVTRGNLTLVSGLKTQLSEEMIAQLYDATVPINCINDISGKGFIVWGNKTTTTSSRFFDRINVARLIKYVTKEAYNISWNYLFEPITEYVFSDWTMKISSFLEAIKLDYGIAEYEVIMDTSINTDQTIAANQLNGIIRIKPQEVAEFINIDFTITDTIIVTVETQAV